MAHYKASPDPSQDDASSPLLRHPTRSRRALNDEEAARTPDPHSYRDADIDAYAEETDAAEGEDADGRGLTASARRRWTVATLILLAAGVAAVVYFVTRGDEGACGTGRRCRNRDPGFPGEDEVGYEGPTPTVRGTGFLFSWPAKGG